MLNFLLTSLIMYVTTQVPRYASRLREIWENFYHFVFRKQMPKAPKNEVTLVFNGEMDTAKNVIKAPFELNAWIDFITKLVEKDSLMPYNEPSYAGAFFGIVFCGWLGYLFYR